MIACNLEHLSDQIHLTPAISKAIAALAQTDWRTVPAGRVEIDGDTVYAMVQTYDTLAPGTEPTFEAHQKYIDIQYVVSGIEVMAWAPLTQWTPTGSFDAVADVGFGTVVANKTTRVPVWPGQLAVFYPTDAHAPRHSLDQPAPIKKVVVKVAVGS